MIAISPFEMEVVLDVVKRHVPECDVLAFGSRYKWSNNDSSDLDLALVSHGKIEFSVIENIKYDFMESDLTFRVDVLDYYAISENFRKIIDRGNEIIHKGRVRPHWQTVRAGDLFVDIPSPEEHREIGHILSCIDEKIVCNLRINALLEQLAQAIYKLQSSDVKSMSGVIPDSYILRYSENAVRLIQEKIHNLCRQNKKLAAIQNTFCVI